MNTDANEATTPSRQLRTGDIPTPPKISSTSSSSSTNSTGGSMNNSQQATYRDLVIFEERLKGNMARLQKRKRKYETLLVGLFISLFYFFYAVFIEPSKVFINHFINTILLLAVAGGLVFFYRSGMYSEKIVYAQKFVPHCNNALQAFNLEFKRQGKSSGSLGFLSKIPKQFQEGFESYRKQYHLRKKARQAKLKKAN